MIGSIAAHKSSSVSSSGFIGLSQSDTDGHISMVDLFRSILSILKGKKALFAEKVQHFWNPINPIVNKVSEVEDQRPREYEVVGYSSIN